MKQLALLCLLVSAANVSAQADVNEETEKAMKAASAKVAPCVARIETSGGQDMIVWTDRSNGAPIRKVAGPTTGLVVDPDGYVITSSFNFINKPTAIFVTIHNKGRAVAKVVATDQSRMLTLLKVDMKGLEVPVAFPKKEIEVGQWSLALGRTLNPNIDQPPSPSVGIISAVGRIWGKAVQTDAKVSPNNYGGPLVGIDGRVMGVLVPASPQSEGDNAGIEWYDSGIGFAIPLEDINRVLPKLKKGTAEKPVNLRGGMFGFPAPQPTQYLSPPTISQVVPESAAEKAGVKAGDLIISVDGKPIFTMAQFLHVIKPLYEGDSFSMKVKRNDKEVNIPKVVLQGAQTAIEPGFLGILPMRDDPAEGLEIRYVYPDSPAAKAGLKQGDRIMKLAPGIVKELTAFAGRDRFMTLMSGFTVNSDVNLEIKQKADGKVKTVTVRLAAFPEDVPERVPDESTKKKALEKPVNLEVKKTPPKKDEPKKDEPKKEEPKKEVPLKEKKDDSKKDGPKKDEPKKDEPKNVDDKKEPLKEVGKDEEPKKEEAKKPEPKKEKIPTGLMQREDKALGRKYWVFVPENYDPNISHGLVVWLHPAGREGRDADDMVRMWRDACEVYNLIMLGPISENKNGWVPTETEGVVADIAAVMGQYTIDKHRVVVHGSGIGGQMAYYLGFNARDQVRGVATVGAVLASQPKDLVPAQRLQFYIAAGEKDPIVKDIKEGKPKLTEKKYNVILRIIEEKGKEYLNESPETFGDMLRWIDSLDRS